MQSSFSLNAGCGAALVTGATGFIGRHFVQHLLEKNQRVIALVRGETDKIAATRLQSDFSGRVAVYAADLRQPHCGLSAQAIQDLQSTAIENIWHIAGNVSFASTAARQVELDNTLGTKHLLDLANIIRPRHFSYVSTAYVGGRGTWMVPETLHPSSSSFRNSYERAKCEAEHLVAEICAEHDLPYSIIRPGIVVGPQGTFGTGGSTTGFYGVLEIFRRATNLICAARQPLRCVASPTAVMHIVPVDTLVDAMASLQMHRQIVHVTGIQPPSLPSILRSIAETMDIPTPQLVVRLPRDATRLEKVLHTKLAPFRPYLMERQDFMFSGNTAFSITENILKQYVQGFLQEAEEARQRQQVAA